MYKWITLLYTLKKKTTHNSANHLYTRIQNKHNRKERKTKELLTLFPSGLEHLGWRPTPGAWAGWVPRRGCPGAEGAGEDMPANKPPTPLDMDFLFPSAWVHNLQILWDPPAAELNLVLPKDGGVSGLEELCKVPRAPCLLVVVFPPPASFLRVTPLRGQVPLQSGVAIIGIAWGMKGKGEEVRRHKP